MPIIIASPIHHIIISDQVPVSPYFRIEAVYRNPSLDGVFDHLIKKRVGILLRDKSFSKYLTIIKRWAIISDGNK